MQVLSTAFASLHIPCDSSSHLPSSFVSLFVFLHLFICKYDISYEWMTTVFAEIIGYVSVHAVRWRVVAIANGGVGRTTLGSAEFVRAIT